MSINSNTQDPFNIAARNRGERVFPCPISGDKIAMGRVFVMDSSCPTPPEETVPPAGREQELAAYHASQAAMKKRYEHHRENAKKLPPDVRLGALETTNFELQLLNDKAFTNKIPDAIRQGKTAAAAVYDVVGSMIMRFAAMPDAKLRVAAEYLEQMRSQLVRDCMGLPLPVTAQTIPDDAIAVTRSLPVGEVIHLMDGQGRARIKALATTHDSELSHTRIVGRGIGLIMPSLNEEIGSQIAHGAEIIVDGKKNLIVTDPDPSTREHYLREITLQKIAREALQKRSSEERKWPQTQDAETVKIYANIGSCAETLNAMHSGAGGIGLYRTELAALSARKAPDKEGWYEIFRHVAEHTQQKLLTVRTVDFEGDKCQDAFKAPERREEIIRDQMHACLRLISEGYTNIHIMIPIVKSAEDMGRYQAMMDEEARALSVNPIRLGAMIEVPAYVDELTATDNPAFFSIGSNDLIFNTLGGGRFDENANSSYDPTNPSVLRSIGVIAEQRGRSPDMSFPVSVCGDMASQPRYFALLMGAGIRNLSVTPDMVPVIKELCHRADTRLCRELFEAIRTNPMRDARETKLDEFNKKYLGLNQDGSLELDLSGDEPAMSLVHS